jgi:ribosome biogenesis GTPase A
VHVDAHAPLEVARLLRRLVSRAAAAAEGREFRGQPFTLAIVGAPNAGKSTLLNALARQGSGQGRRAKTGAVPGITRSLSGYVTVHRGPLIVRLPLRPY